MQSNSFHNSERLKSRKTISLLFQRGRTIHAPPFRIRWVCIDTGQIAPVQVAFSIPKRIFPKAVDRNHIKRKAREAYRLNKQTLYDALVPSEKKFALMFIYQKKEVFDYHQIEEIIQAVLPKIAEAFNAYQLNKRTTR